MHDIVIFLWTRDEINTHSRSQTLKWRFYLALLNVSRPWKGNIQVHCIYHLEIKVDTDVFPAQLVRLRNSSAPRSHHGCSKTQDFHFVPRHFSYTLRIHKPIAEDPISPYFSSCRKRPLLMQSDLIFFEGKPGNEINTVIHKTSNSLKANVCLTKPMSAENISWRCCRLFDLLKICANWIFLCKKWKQINSQAYPAAGPLNKKSWSRRPLTVYFEYVSIH